MLKQLQAVKMESLALFGRRLPERVDGLGIQASEVRARTAASPIVALRGLCPGRVLLRRRP
jgi:hypothetical protein